MNRAVNGSHVRKLGLSAGTVFLLIPSWVGAQQPIDIPQIVSRAADAVVLIKAFDDQGNEIGLGSGFRIMGGRIATNAHVVKNSGRVEVFDKSGQLLGTTRFADALSTTVDLAVLPRLGRYTTILPLASRLPTVGEPVVVIGAPKGFANTVTNGIVSAVRTVDDRTLIQISAPISPGSSGGPILNAQGQVIGIAVATYRDAQNLNFAVPVADLMAVMESPVAQIPFPKDGETSSTENSSTPRPRPPSLRMNVPTAGALSASDVQLDDGTFMDLFTFEGRAGQAVSFLLISADFDGTLELAHYVGDSIVIDAFDDDSGGGTNAMLNATLSTSGVYYVAVSSPKEADDKLGGYTLDPRYGLRPVASRSSSAGVSRWVLAGESTNGNWEIDTRSLSGQGAGVYQFWSRILYQSRQTDSAGDTYDREMRQMQVDCTRRVRRGAGPYQYLGDRLVWSPSALRWSDWNAVVPGSVGELVLESACRLAASERK